MSDGRRLLLVAGPGDAPPPDPTIAAVVVLDTAWTPGPGERPDLVPVRTAVAAVLEQSDLFAESYRLLEAWADTIGLADRFMVDGISWWYRRRLGYSLWLHERLLWRGVLDDLLARLGPLDAIELLADEPALGEVVRLVAERDRIAGRTPAGRAPADADGRAASGAAVSADGSRVDALAQRVLGGYGRRARRRELERRTAVLADRIATLATGTTRRLLFITNPVVHQVVRTAAGERRVDPFLGPIAERLAGSGLEPVVLDVGADPRTDEAWPALEADDARLPGTLLASRWSSTEDGLAAEAVVEALETAPAAPLDAGGIDLAPTLLAELRRYARAALPGRLRESARARRLLRELRPAGIILVNEYGHTEWLAAGRLAGVPVFAVQHGIIYPWHVGYRHRRDPAIPLPTRTFLFGAYEERVLLEDGGYRSEELEVTGAPRLALGDGKDLAADPSSPGRSAERAAVRRELGVRDGDRLLLVSTTGERLHRRFYWMHALGRLLDAPLPGIHVVFKQHPKESDEGPYRTLVEGLARAGGYAPPPVSVVRDVDLYRLLRAADAHLGLYSTVLTDAVAAGTPNLVAYTQAHRDLLGYVAAGVGRPVRNAGELRDALAGPLSVDPDARRAFLEDHFRPGDAAERIATSILERLGPGGAP